MDTALPILKQAVAAHQAGDLAEAERLYRSVLAIDPRQFDALHLSGVAAAQRGRYEDADRLFRAALAVNPRSAAAHANHAFALKELKQFAAALASCDAALALQPNDVGTLANRAIVLRALGRPAEALAAYDRVVATRPDDAGAWSARAELLAAMGRHGEAVASHDRALALKPNDAQTLTNRGVALTELGRHEEALASYDRALALAPDRVEAINNRGAVLAELQRFDEALASYDRALALAPGHAGVLNNRGNALVHLRRHGEALETYDRALRSEPDRIDVLSNRANALMGLGRWDEALAAYDRLLERGPASAEALGNRGNVLMEMRRYEAAARDFAAAIRIDPDCKYARGKLLHARMQACDWSALTADLAALSDGVARGKPCITPFPLLAASDSPALQLACARIYVKDTCPPAPDSLWRGERYAHDRIRVAYLSSDFREHATTHLIAELIERHDRTRFETIALSWGAGAGTPGRRRMESAFERFVDVDGMSDRAAARLMRELEVDIAVDLMGFTQNARPEILAFRPAPVQVSYLAYPGTMGAAYIDYLLADGFVVPESQSVHFSESIVRLPDAYQANDSQRTPSSRSVSRADAGLPERGVVFCCFNQAFKILPDTFAVWMRLLRQVEGSVLWLLEGAASAERNLRRSAEERGVAADRLVFAPRVAVEDHLARHALADLMLDTLPYNAHTTASDALWMGLPVVTCPGATFAARVCGSLLSAAGVPELIAGSMAEYEALALKLARDATLRSAIRDTLIRNRGTCRLFDTDRLRRHVESAYETMWRRHRDGLPPASFAVAPIE